MKHIEIRWYDVKTLELKNGEEKTILAWDNDKGIHECKAVKYGHYGYLKFWPNVDSHYCDDLTSVVYWAECPKLE